MILIIDAWRIFVDICRHIHLVMSSAIVTAFILDAKKCINYLSTLIKINKLFQSPVTVELETKFDHELQSTGTFLIITNNRWSKFLLGASIVKTDGNNWSLSLCDGFTSGCILAGPHQIYEAWTRDQHKKISISRTKYLDNKFITAPQIYSPVHYPQSFEGDVDFYININADFEYSWWSKKLLKAFKQTYRLRIFTTKFGDVRYKLEQIKFNAKAPNYHLQQTLILKQ